MILLIAFVLIYFQSQVESESKVLGYWKVEKIILNKKDVSNEYKNLDFNMAQWNNYLVVPIHKNAKYFKESGHGVWEYSKQDMQNAILILKGTHQGIFDGEYDVEMIKKNPPARMHLFSDSIELFLIRDRFSINKPFIGY